jgi:hypothetical protein
MPPYTEPQRRALKWLPSDGSWITILGKVAPAIDSLRLYHNALVDIEAGPFGARGGYMRRARLTEAGVVAARELGQ